MNPPPGLLHDVDSFGCHLSVAARSQPDGSRISFELLILVLRVQLDPIA
jgi:hypothetical protein